MCITRETMESSCDGYILNPELGITVLGLIDLEVVGLSLYSGVTTPQQGA